MKRPTTDEIVELLRQPGFRRGEGGEDEPSSDPIVPTAMVLEVDRIRPYDRNPRRTANSEYEAIKESIRAVGMDQTLTVTRRPGDEDYMIGAGGNTRLLAVQELWRETGEDRFRRVNVLFVPWRGDADTLVAHLRENDLRGALTLVDRAFAIRELRAMLEEEREEPLSTRALSEALRERGYRIGKSMIALYDYVVDFLHPAIPTALAAGMGKPQIERIQALDRAFLAVWRALGIDDPGAGRAIFREVLARHDGETLDLDRLRMDLHAELSVSADIGAELAALLLGAALDGRDVAELLARHPVDEDEALDGPDGGEAPAAETPGATAPGPDAGDAVPEGAAAPSTPPGRAEIPSTNHATGAVHQVDTSSGDDPAADPPRKDGEGGDARARVRALRARAADLAETLAREAGLPEDLVIRVPNNGCGYIVGNVRLGRPGEDYDDKRRKAIVWWLLASVSEQFTFHNMAWMYLPPTQRSGSTVGQLATKARYNEWPKEGPWACIWLQYRVRYNGNGVYAEVPPPNPVDIGPYVCANAALWRTWLELVDVYLELRRLMIQELGEEAIWLGLERAEGKRGLRELRRRQALESGLTYLADDDDDGYDETGDFE